MNAWIDLHALWRIVVIGLICGAGLPAVFALGLKALGGADGDESATGGTATLSRTNPLRVAVAAVCFAVVLAAIGWGIYLIVDGT
ncbi:hypothetical protein [uncultured Jatrophihabitans sp.]|uniref:hypothetical protein n=1 Tax=uncultured Jatrophihabitans sp. TaxID=1610747 RepID=UPI0035CA2413